jgi:hypothetical protein
MTTAWQLLPLVGIQLCTASPSLCTWIPPVANVVASAVPSADGAHTPSRPGSETPPATAAPPVSDRNPANKPDGPSTPAGVRRDPIRDLEEGWVVVEGLGLRFRPPQPALGKNETLNGVLRYEVVEGSESPRWWLRFQNLTSSQSGLTAKDQINAYLDALTKNGKTYTVTIDEAITVSGSQGEGRFVILESPLPEGGTGTSGWVIVPIGDDRYLVCSLVAPTATFAAVLPALRESFQSMTVLSPSEVVAERRDRIDRGMEMLRFSEATLRGALQSDPLLYRVFRQGSRQDGSDDVEIGWMTVRAIEGMRGEVDGSRDPAKLRPEEMEKGLLVIVQAKTIVDAEGTNLVDTESRYWVAWDRTGEVWSIRATQRQRDAARTTSQTGVRTPPRRGDPRPMLRVVNSTGMSEPLEWAVPSNYISQAELIMLGRLLPRGNPKPEPFASYAFDPKTNSLPQRIDSLRRNDDGTWTLESRIGASPTPLVQTFDEKGNRSKRVDVDALGAVVTERISSEKLKAIWRAKGLPIQ